LQVGIHEKASCLRADRTMCCIVRQARRACQCLARAFCRLPSVFAIVDAMTLPEAPFFDYTCDLCGAALCERVQIMNLALNYVETLYCLACLAEEQGLTQEAMADFAREYVYARECFKTPWYHFGAQARQCPRLPLLQCFCQDSPPNAGAP
jgi:hypothetical protein